MDISSEAHSHVRFSLENGVLYYKRRLVIPRTSGLIAAIMGEFHNSPMEGYSGETKSYQRTASKLFWMGMRKDVVKYVQECIVCW